MLGQVRVQELVGVGSMGRVYRAFQTGTDRNVAVKILHTELTVNRVLVGRFLREAKVASRLSHPNVVQVLMAGQLQSHEEGGTAKGRGSAIDGALYIVMEYLDGVSLGSALASSEGKFPLARALRIVLQICDAVGEAHAQGIVHRDLKPENVMLVRRGRDADFVKVLDFGIARWSGSDGSQPTQTGLVLGTARYISPEGAKGQPVGPPADVYAIATMLYQALAGRPPFDATSAVALLAQHSNEPPPSLSSHPTAADVPPSLAALIMENLSKRPQDRASDARAFGLSLLAAAQSSGIARDEILGTGSLLSLPGSSSTDVGGTTRRLDVGYRLAVVPEATLSSLLPRSLRDDRSPPRGPRSGDLRFSGPAAPASPVPLETESPSAARSLAVPPAGHEQRSTPPTLCQLPPTPPTLCEQPPTQDPLPERPPTPPTLQAGSPRSPLPKPAGKSPRLGGSAPHPSTGTVIADLAAGESTPDPSTPDSPRLRAHLATPDGSSISGDGPPYTPSRLTIAAVVGGCILLGAGLASLGAYRWGLWGDTSSEDRVSGEESDLVPQQLPVPLPTGSTGGSAQPPAPPAIEPRNDNAEPSHLYPDSAPR